MHGKGLGIFALMALLAGPAPAQDVAFLPAATESCLAAAEPATRRDCIGEAANVCMDGDDGSTTVGMGFCLGAERDWWDARLNGAYAALMAVEEASDAEMRELGSAAPSTAEALRAMQRAWMGWRDAACEYEYSQWGGGTGGGPAATRCVMQMTGEQALALTDRLEAKHGP